MRAALWMAGASLGSWLAVTAISGGEFDPEAAYGMAGPLGVAVVSFVGYERVHRAAPERLTSAMIVALALKMAFFGVYVVGMVRVAGMRPVPFIVSFAAYFIGLHAMEAWFLRRLLAGSLAAAGPEGA